MKYEKKNLLVVAAAGMLSLVMVSGCGPKETTGKTGDSTTNTNTTPKPDKKDDQPGAAAYNWSNLDKASFDSKVDASMLAKSGDDKNAYVVVGANSQLFQADAADLTKWEEVKWDATNGTNLGDTPGAAKLAASKKIIGLTSIKEGVLVDRVVDPVASNADNGVAVLKGKAYTAAWGSAKKHVLDQTVGLSILGGPLSSGVVSNAAGVEFPVFFVRGSNSGISGDKVGAFASARADQWVGPRPATFGNPANFSSAPKVVMGTVGAYFVDKDAAYLLASADIGKAQAWKVDSKSASSNWKFNKGPDNNNVSAVAFVNGKLHIGLKATAPNTGGVVVYDPAATKNNTVAPADAWKGVSVVDLAVNGEDVWVVTKDNLWNLAHSNTFETGKVPTNITGAVFVGGNLIVTTSDKGVHVAMKK